MADDFSVSATRNQAHRPTPFDNILSLEQEQEARVRKEKDVMDAAEKKEAESLREHEQRRAKEVRANALKELDEFERNVLPMQMKDAERAGKDEQSRIERSAAAKKKAVVEKLVERMLAPEMLRRFRP